jgi:hypothetical protein
MGESMESTAYEDRLGDALEKLLEGGSDDLATLASGLNSLGVHAQDGASWSAESLEAEFKRLAAAARAWERERTQ